MPSEQLLPCSLSGEWRHNNGFMFNGTLRIFRADFDTNPSDEFIAEVLSWVVDKLNTCVSVPAVPQRFECTACGAELNADQVDGLGGHCRSDDDGKGNEIPVHCGPCVPAVPVGEGVEQGWLLEKQEAGNIWYITVDQMLTWTTDPLKALRLARREDAEMLCEIVEDCEKVAEHQWGFATPAPKPAGKCVKCGHLKLDPWRGYCKHEVTPFGKRPIKYCGCKCEFSVPTASEEETDCAPFEQTIEDNML